MLTILAYSMVVVFMALIMTKRLPAVVALILVPIVFGLLGVFPKDYTLVASRIMLISKNATNPNAAKLWVDYVLSKRGQTVIANNARLFAVRSDVSGETTAARLTQSLGASIRPIPVGPTLIGYLNNQNYRDFIQQWRRAEATP